MTIFVSWKGDINYLYKGENDKWQSVFSDKNSYAMIIVDSKKIWKMNVLIPQLVKQNKSYVIISSEYNRFINENYDFLNELDGNLYIFLDKELKDVNLDEIGEIHYLFGHVYYDIYKFDGYKSEP